MKIIAITPYQKMDSLATLVIDGLYNNGVEVIATDPGNNVKQVYANDEVLEHAKDADYIFAIWGKHGANGIRAPKFYLLDQINRPEIVAYVDGSEWTCTGFPDSPTQLRDALTDVNRHRGNPWINEEMYNKCSWYFKRIVFEQDLEREKIIPCYLGAWNEYFGETDFQKEYDFYCSFGGIAGHTDTGLRRPIYDYCKNLNGVNSIVGQRLNHKMYLEAISKSYIGISSWGAGNCCRRMWEILSNKTCCFIQKPLIVYPHQLVDGESCVYYETMEEFKEKLDYYLSHKEECVRIGQNGYEHVKKYHTADARVKQMLTRMEASS
jgi:hypothetical protein